MADVQVLIEPFEEAALPLGRLLDIAVRHPGVAEMFGAFDPERLVVGEPEVLGREKDDQSPFVATLFDPVSNRALKLTGRLDAPDQLEVRPIAFAPVPDPGELHQALEVLRADQGFAALVDR